MCALSFSRQCHLRQRYLDFVRHACFSYTRVRSSLIGVVLIFVKFPYSFLCNFCIYCIQIGSRVAVVAARRTAAVVAQRRGVAQTVPKVGSLDQMEAEALEQLKARIAVQKEIFQHQHKSDAEEMDEMWKWVKISLMVALPVCVLASFKDILFGDHHHPDEGPQPDYMKIRNKEFPWECEDCALFDSQCWKQCRAEMGK